MARETFSLMTWGQRLFLLVFTLFALSLAAIVWAKSQEGRHRNSEAAFENQVDKLAFSVAERMRLYTTMLRGAASFWESNPTASRQDWHVYLSRQALWEQFPGMDALSYAQRVPRAESAVFAQKMKAEVAQDFAYQPTPFQGLPGAIPEEKAPEDMIIITHFEPYAQNRARLLGLDMSRQQQRLKVAQLAQDSGQVSITSPLSLITGAGTQVDFLMMAPVYRASFPTSTVEQRQKALLGWVMVGLHGNSLAQAILGEARLQGYDIRLSAKGENGDLVNLLTPPGEESIHYSPLFRSERALTVAGQSWQLEIQSTSRLEQQLQGDRWWALAVNLSLAALLSAGAMLLMISRQQSRLLAVQALEQLTERERHYQSVVEGTVEGYWQIDPITRQTIAVNSSLCDMLGYERHEILGHTPTRFCHPDAAAEFSRHIDALWDKEHRVYDITLMRKDGSPLFAHISASTLRDNKGRVETVFAMVTDITTATLLKNALTEKTRALEASNSDLQQFAYVASHDLQAPLRMVSSYLQLLERRYNSQLNDEAREFIGFAVEGARRMSRLIHDLLAFSRVETAGNGMAAVAPQAVIQQAIANLELTIKSKNATIDSQDHFPMIWADSGQISSLFQNLIGNALKYCPDDRPPHVTITGSVTEADNDHDPMVEFSIADNGIGIPTDQYNRIFLIFQRLHGPEEYEGTGIGLALVKRIVERHNGRIWLEPNRRTDGSVEGTIFHVALPAAPPPAVTDDLSVPAYAQNTAKEPSLTPES